MIADGDDAARGRIHMNTDGTGVSLRVGTTRIYCAHGNEIDPWNVTDHERIRRIGRDVLQGKGYEEWVPNAGTQLVIDAMNDVKREFPFVDLLKPETEAVIPILLAIKPDLAAKIINAPRVVARRTRDAVRMASGFLGDHEFSAGEKSQPLTPLAEVASRARTREFAKTLLDDADKQFQAQRSPMDLVSVDQRGRQLGNLSAIWVGITGGSTAEILREKLEALKHDRSFDTTHMDETFYEFDERIGDDAEVIVTGHTHLERAHKRKAASGYYFNTGTWARLMKIDESRLNDPGRFDEMFKAIQQGSMAALEKVPDLVIRNNTVFSARLVSGSVEIKLSHVRKPETSFDLCPVPNTTFTIR